MGYAEYLLSNVVSTSIANANEQGDGEAVVKDNSEGIEQENEPLCIYGCLLCL